MTRIGTSYRTPSLRALPAPRRNQRAAPLAAKLAGEANAVSDLPIEEVIFEPNGGVDQKTKHRWYLASEVKEEVLVERSKSGRNLNAELDHDEFWQRFSTPFMAQMIGQTGNRAPKARQAYRQAIAAQPPAKLIQRFSKAV